MNNEKIAPKVFPNFDKQLKDGKIPIYISNILKNISEPNDRKGLEKILIAHTSYLEHDEKLKKVFLNFGWDGKKIKFSKEINFKDLNQIIQKEYQIGFARETVKIPDAVLENLPTENHAITEPKIANNINFAECDQLELNKNYFFLEADKKKDSNKSASEKTQIKIIANKNPDIILTQMGREATELAQAETEKTFFTSDANFNNDEKNQKKQNEENKNLLFLSAEKKTKQDFNRTKSQKELTSDAEAANPNNNLTQSLLKSAGKSYKTLMLSNIKNLSICENDFDEDSASIKKPIATTVSLNSYPLDYSKITLLQNEQNKNPLLNSSISNLNINNNNEDNLKMQNILINSHQRLSTNNNNIINNNSNYYVNSPYLNFNNIINMNSNNNNSNNNFFENSNNNYESEIPKIITPKFNKILATAINNPLKNLNPSANFFSNNINNNILININNNKIPLETNHIPINSNTNLNSYQIPNSPTMNFNSNIFAKSSFTKNPSNFSCHGSPGNGIGFNPSSAFNPNLLNFKGAPLNSPHSIKSLDLNPQASFNNNTKNFYFNNNLNNNNIRRNFYPGIEEIRKISPSNSGSTYSNKVSHNKLPGIKSKNLCFLEADNNQNCNENIKTENNFSDKNLMNKKNSIHNYNYINYNFNNEENNLLNSTKRNHSLNNNNNNYQEMRHKKNSFSKSQKKIEKTEEENNNEINSYEKIRNINKKFNSEFQKKVSWTNPNVTIISKENCSLNVLLINKKILVEKTENITLPILEKLTKNKNEKNNLPLEANCAVAEVGRQKRCIQRNKRFFDEEHFHFDNSFWKIVTRKNTQNSANTTNFINSSNAKINGSDNSTYGNSAGLNLIKRKRKKPISKLGKRSSSKAFYDKYNNNNNNNLNFYDFNLAQRKYKKPKNNGIEDNKDQEPSTPSSGEEDDKSSNGHLLTDAYKKTKLIKLKSNKIYQSGNTFNNNYKNINNNKNYKNNLDPEAEELNLINNNNYNYNKNFYQKHLNELSVNNNYKNNINNYKNIYNKSNKLNKEHFQLGLPSQQSEKAQVGRRRKNRKNQKLMLNESEKTRKSSQKRFFNSRNTSYGLKEISKNVLKIVKKCKLTTYKEISDMIISDINADLNGSKDEKNIRRRIYDSLNVMKAMNIFKKEKNLKNIVFNDSAQNAFLLSFLEKEDSDGASQARKGILLRNSVQPLKHSVFADKKAFDYNNCVSNNNNNDFIYEYEKNICNVNKNFSSKNNFIAHTKNFEKVEELEINKIEGYANNEHLENNKENRNSHKINTEYIQTELNEKDEINVKQIKFNQQKTTYAAENCYEPKNKEAEEPKETINFKTKEEQAEQNMKFVPHQNLLQRKLSSESNFRPTACNSNTNINNKININIYNDVRKSDFADNPLYYNNSLRAANMSIPGIETCFNIFPYVFNPNNNLINPSFKANRRNNFNLFQDNGNNTNNDAYQQLNLIENRDNAYLNYKDSGCRSKKQLIDKLKNLISGKKRVLNTKLLEINLLKYNSELIAKLISYNKKNAQNVNEDDKIKFPFICVEFPSYKKSEVNIAINDEKTKLYCNFEDEVNIYGDLDLIKRISKINSFDNELN